MSIALNLLSMLVMVITGGISYYMYYRDRRDKQTGYFTCMRSMAGLAEYYPTYLTLVIWGLCSAGFFISGCKLIVEFLR